MPTTGSSWLISSSARQLSLRYYYFTALILSNNLYTFTWSNYITVSNFFNKIKEEFLKTLNMYCLINHYIYPERIPLNHFSTLPLHTRKKRAYKVLHDLVGYWIAAGLSLLLSPFLYFVPLVIGYHYSCWHHDKRITTLVLTVIFIFYFWGCFLVVRLLITITFSCDIWQWLVFRHRFYSGIFDLTLQNVEESEKLTKVMWRQTISL